MIPNLPTDNLYKFMALSGLVIFVFFAYLAQTNESEYNEQLLYIKIKNDTIKEKLDLIKNNLMLSSPKTQLSEMKKISLEQIELGSKMKKYEELDDKFLRKSILLCLACLLGSLIAFVGFILWYFKVQKPLDKILANDLAKSEYERAKLDKQT